MTTWAILPVKALQGGKQRLAGSLDTVQREALCVALLGDALDALTGSRRLDGVLVVTRDPAVTGIARHVGVTVLHESGQGLNVAVTDAAHWAFDHGAETVLIMHADLPLVSAAAIDALLRRHQAADGPHCTLVPDRHAQGTNALVVSPPCAMPFRFGEDSLNQHLMAAAHQGLRCSVVPDDALGHDLDTPEDLQALLSMSRRDAGKAIRLLRDGIAG